MQISWPNTGAKTVNSSSTNCTVRNLHTSGIGAGPVQYKTCRFKINFGLLKSILVISSGSIASFFIIFTILNNFRVTGHLCGEFTDLREIPCTKGQWRGALMFFFICVWINGWEKIVRLVIYDVIVMIFI